MFRGSVLLLIFFNVLASHADNPTNFCKNNGTPLNSTTCSCPAYVGGQKCEIIKCQRFSIPDKNRCACPPGWYDKYCGLRGCRPPNEDNLDLSKRSFIIIFNTKTSMAKQLEVLKNRFTELTNSITKDIKTGETNNWIANYIFYGFVQNGSNFTVQQLNTDNSDKLLKFLSNVQLSDGDTHQPVLTALRNAQQTFPNMKSHAIVLVFTDSPSSEATSWSHRFTDKNMEQTCLQISLLWRSKISFILSLPIESTAFDNTTQPSDSVDVYRRLSLTNHGDTFYVKNEMETDEILSKVIPTYYFPENLAVGYGMYGNTTIKAVRDNSDDVVFVLITFDHSSKLGSGSTKPKLIKGHLHSEGAFYKLYKHSSNSSVLNMVSISSEKYNYRVFIQSKNTILIDYNDDMTIDVGNGIAVIGIGMSATMKLFEFDTLNMINSSYGVFSSNNSLIRKNFYSFERPQLDCTFNFGFEVWDTLKCPPGPITQFHTINYKGGYTKQRVTTGYCIQSDHNNDKLPQITKTSEENIAKKSEYLKTTNDPRLEGPKQFIFILEQHPGNKKIYQTLAKEIGEIVEHLKNNDEYDSNIYRNEYTLIIHCNKESRVLMSTYNPDLFVRKVPELIDSIHYVNSLDNTMGLLSIVQAQKLNIRPTSQVYYFTNQAVKNVQNISRTWDIVDRNIEFNFFTIADGVTTEVFALPWQLELVQKISNGRIIPLGNDEISIKNVIGDISGMNALTTDMRKHDCHTQPFELDAFIEAGSLSTNIQIIGSSSIGNIAIKDNNDYPLEISEYLTFNSSSFASLMIKESPLTSGIWKIRVSTTHGGCQVTVRQQSKISVIVGFSGDLAKTFINTQIPSQRSDQNQSIFVPIRVVQSIESVQVVPTLLKIESVNPDRYDMPTLFLTSNITTESGFISSYTYSTPRILMPKSELSFWTVTGVLKGETAFIRRFYYYQHFPRDVSVCHGGKVDQYGQCICPPNYTGEYCEDRICAEGATSSYGMCSCSPGFYGDFCEIKLLIPSS